MDTGAIHLPGWLSFFQGDPPVLSNMLYRGELDVALVPSAEYARLGDGWFILGDLCVGSSGKVKSVVLLSHVPIERVREVYLTGRSRTSRALLLYILRSHFGLDIVEKELDGDWRDKPSVLLIGDEALYAVKEGLFPYVYDVSELWYSLEGLPFVFAFWCVRGEYLRENRKKVEEVLGLLERARSWSLERLEEVSRRWVEEGGFLSPDETFDYLSSIEYTMEDAHIAGLKRFFERAIGRSVPLRFVSA